MADAGAATRLTSELNLLIARNEDGNGLVSDPSLRRVVEVRIRVASFEFES